MSAESNDTIIAVKLRSPLVHGFPANSDWERARPIEFDRNWQGKNPDPHRRTEVRLLWNADEIYLQFLCRFRELFTFDAADREDGRKDHLWDRDVAEAFLQPDHFGEKHYTEFEISPNGFWIDLQITPKSDLADLQSRLRRQVTLDRAARVWMAQLAIPVQAITRSFSPQQPWRGNFFRCEGRDPNRAYLSWRPTNTPEPNFHVPERFGTLLFRE